ncbi:TPA: hypothetical protein ACIYDF_005736, partial [Escherichia coli]
SLLSPRSKTNVIVGSRNDRNIMITVGIAVAGFPAMSTPVFMVSVCFSVKIKGRDDGTINNHDESHLFGPDERRA